jgi:hypothetical protein
MCCCCMQMGCVQVCCVLRAAGELRCAAVQLCSGAVQRTVCSCAVLCAAITSTGLCCALSCSCSGFCVAVRTPRWPPHPLRDSSYAAVGRQRSAITTPPNSKFPNAPRTNVVSGGHRAADAAGGRRTPENRRAMSGNCLAQQWRPCAGAVEVRTWN